jgi:hypothetical protein
VGRLDPARGMALDSSAENFLLPIFFKNPF